MEVGIREFKAHLSSYIAQARKGEAVVVTDRGKPVVRLEPVPADVPLELQHLVRTGRLIWKGRPRGAFPPPIPMLPGEKTTTDYVREQRD